MRRLRVVALVLVAAVAVVAPAAPALAASRAGHVTSVAPACRRPVIAYWVYDTANPGRGRFLVDAGSLTSGLFVGWGGTWVLGQQVHLCRG